MGGWTNPSIAGGGTLTGDVTITGDLTVQGTTASVVNQTISGTVIIDVDNAEALLVRKDGDAGDILVINTLTENHALNSTIDAATGNETALTLAYTVNKATSGDDTGLLISLTDTASPGTSRLLDLHVGGATQFFVDRNGLVQFEGQVRGANANAPTMLDEAASATNPTLIPNLANTTTGIGGASGEVSLITGGVEAVRIDSNQDVGIGTTPVTGSQLVLPQENDAVTPTLSFGDGDTGFYEAADDELRVSVGGTPRWTFLVSGFQSNGTSGPLILDQTSAATTVTIVANRTVTNTGVGGITGQISLIVGGAESINMSVSSLIMETKFDAGDNAAGNVGAWTSVLSAVATISSSAAATLTASSLIPAGCHLLGLTARITTGFGTSTGLTDFDVGDGSDPDRWGRTMAITSGTTLDLTDATAASSGDFAAANDVVLTAFGGNFDGTGVIELIAHYITLTAPTG